MRTPRWFALAPLVLLILLLSAAASAPTREASPKPRLRIGVILAATGPAAYIGAPEKVVVEALIAELAAAGHNPLGVTLDVRDSGSDPAVALRHFDELAADTTVVAIIGSSTSGESIPLGARADALEVPLLALAASRLIVEDGSGGVRPWAFKFAPNDDLVARRLTALMAERGEREVGVLYAADGFGESGARVFREAAAAAGIRVTHDASFPAALLHAGPVVDAVPAATRNLMIWGTVGVDLLVQGLRQAGRDGTTVYLSFSNASDEWVASAGPAADGVLITGTRVLVDPAHLDPATDRVLIDYRSFWDRHATGLPDQFGGHARDALVTTLAVLDADVAAMPTADRRRAVRERLETRGPFVGVTGTFRFSAVDHAGLAPNDLEVYRIEGGRFVPFAGGAPRP